ncbi:helix-turn-helix transcriptional regulator [Clostridium botulinum]|nr:hypothetical protein ACP50_04320 [Clostridium botulinum]MBY6988478.1 helix-turn-helix transcriptional regulator [Clostridium botulinum]
MFKELRKKTGYSTEHVAKLLKINKWTLYKFEEYHLLPSIKILLGMREIYNCSYEEIMQSYEFAKGVYNERRINKTS